MSVSGASVTFWKSSDGAPNSSDPGPARPRDTGNTMRIAATADIHYTPQSYDSLREPMARVRDEADLLVIAGDLTNYGKPEEMRSLLNALVRLRIPIVAVLGNHDYEAGR